MRYTRVHALQKIASFLLCAALLCSAVASAENLSVSNVSVSTAPLQTQSASTNGMVRVFLSSLGSPSSLKLTIVGNYSLSNGTYLSSGESLTVGFSSSTGAITLTRNGSTLKMGQYFALRRHSASGTNGVKIAQARQPSNPYPGDLSFQAVRQSGGSYKLYTVAHVYIEQYLYGVLPYEMGNSAHIEALKAQAVAARTYTVRMMASRASGLYDVVDTTNDQVYNGTPSGYANCVAAVDSTKGIVATNGSGYTATYYSASNGGQTESIRNIWGSTGYDYLTVKDDPFDYANPNCTVKKTTVYADCSSASNNASLLSLLKSKAVSALQASGYSATSANTTLTTVKSITPHTPKYASPSRLYTKMDFELTASVNGSTVSTTVTCGIFTELESLLGMSIQSSSNELWTVVKSGSTFSLQARRYGHGMGMSQRGAMYMGKLGYSYAQILGFYYPGCTRVQKNFTNTILSANSDEEIIVVEDPADIDDETTGNAVVRLVSSNASLAIRASKSTSGKLLGTIANGSPLTALANDGTWCFVQFGGLKGYVPTSALSLTGSVPTSTDDETPTDVLCFATVRASDFLNLRASASGSAKVVSTAPTGAVLTVFSKDGSWAHVQFGATVAYASVDFLSFSDTYAGTVESTGSTTATVTLEGGEGTVNMRASASTSSEVLAKLANGTQVQVARDDGAWCMVTYQGVTGYIIATYLTYDDQVVESKPDDDEKDDEPTDGTTATVAVSAAILYADSTEDSQELDEIAAGQSVVVTTKGDVWCAVRYDGVSGYMLTAHLRFADTPTSGKTATVVTQSGSLNMRQEPRAGSPIWTQIPRGAIVTVTSVGDTWSAVSYGGYTGYAMTMFLQIEGEANTPDDDTPATGSAIVTTISGSLNLRALPQAGSQILRTIPRNATVAVLERGAVWCGVSYGGTSGYAMSAFLTFTASDVPPDEPTDDTPSDTTVSAVVTTSSGSLNLRDQPSGKVIATIPRNATVSVSQRGDSWCQVTYGGRAGYVMTTYLTFASSDAPSDNKPSDDDTASSATATVVTPSGSLNLRETASLSAHVIASIPRYQSVTVLQRGDAWSKLDYQGNIGYSQTVFLRFDDETVAAASATATDTTEEPSDDANDVATTPTDAETSIAAWVLTPRGSLNLRETPDEDAAILAEIPRLAQVTVLRDGASWCKLRYGEVSGYAKTKYITTSEPSDAEDGMADEPAETTDPALTEDQSNDARLDPTMQRVSGERYATVTPLDNQETQALQSACSERSAVVCELPLGASVQLIGVGAEWCEVLYGDLVGYCLSEALEWIVD